GAPQHRFQNRTVDLCAAHAALPGGADQDLPGRPRSYVEGHAFARKCLYALGIAQLDDLMAEEARERSVITRWPLRGWTGRPGVSRAASVPAALRSAEALHAVPSLSLARPPPIETTAAPCRNTAPRATARRIIQRATAGA